jgi:hypothetical protein
MGLAWVSLLCISSNIIIVLTLNQASPHVAGLCAYLIGLYVLMGPDIVASMVHALASLTAQTVIDPDHKDTYYIASNGENFNKTIF